MGPLKCPVCNNPMSYSVTVWGARKKKAPCSYWMCTRNFEPPTEEMVKAMRQFMRWWKGLTQLPKTEKDGHGVSDR